MARLANPFSVETPHWRSDDGPREPLTPCKQPSDFVHRKPQRATGASQDAIGTIARLMFRLRECEAERDQLREATENSAVKILDRIIELTTQLFHSSVHVYTSRDPEFPEDSTIVFSVTTPLEANQILNAEFEWVKAVAQIAPKSSGAISLLAYPKE